MVYGMCKVEKRQAHCGFQPVYTESRYFLSKLYKATALNSAYSPAIGLEFFMILVYNGYKPFVF